MKDFGIKKCLGIKKRKKKQVKKKNLVPTHF